MHDAKSDNNNTANFEFRRRQPDRHKHVKTRRSTSFLPSERILQIRCPPQQRCPSSPKRQPKSDKIKDSNMIAQDEARRTVSAGSRDGENSMRREISTAKKAIGSPTSVQWSAHGERVACTREAHSSRNVIQKRVWHGRNSNSPDFMDASAARHDAKRGNSTQSSTR